MHMRTPGGDNSWTSIPTICSSFVPRVSPVPGRARATHEQAVVLGPAMFRAIHDLGLQHRTTELSCQIRAKTRPAPFRRGLQVPKAFVPFPLASRLQQAETARGRFPLLFRPG
jgi:hypothetical protein